MLALTFKDKSDYDKIREDDTFNLIDLDRFSVVGLILELIHTTVHLKVLNVITLMQHKLSGLKRML